jgi:hypothetical protein
MRVSDNGVRKRIFGHTRYEVTGVEGAVRGLEGTHLADTCILTRLE